MLVHGIAENAEAAFCARVYMASRTLDELLVTAAAISSTDVSTTAARFADITGFIKASLSPFPKDAMRVSKDERAERTAVVSRDTPIVTEPSIVHHSFLFL